MTKGTCVIEGCESSAYVRGWCRVHYERWLKHGDPLKTRPSAIERVITNIAITPGPLPTDCWLSTYAVNVAGYSTMYVGNGRYAMTHRFTYEHFIGAVPDGLELDHLCGIRNCVNPEHLEAVTHHVNILRGNSIGAVAIRTNLCKRGHSLIDAYITRAGYRKCRTCTQLSNAKRYRSTTSVSDPLTTNPNI